jgi:hypothetical protein
MPALAERSPQVIHNARDNLHLTVWLLPDGIVFTGVRHWPRVANPENGPARPAVGGPMEGKPVYHSRPATTRCWRFQASTSRPHKGLFRGRRFSGAHPSRTHALQAASVTLDGVPVGDSVRKNGTKMPGGMSRRWFLW